MYSDAERNQCFGLINPVNLIGVCLPDVLIQPEESRC